ncbi:unnamed protein product [Trichobilharzia regenti]|nr:unnamed protein product [Trichobilharzia regenti]
MYFLTGSFLSQEIRNRFDRFAEGVLQTIISLMSNCAKVMATSGIVAMRFILENTCSPRLLPILISSLSSKSNITRKCICEFLEIIFTTWPVNILEKNLTTLQDALKRGISDADQEARSFSRRAFPSFVTKFPEQANTFLQNLDAQKRKLIEKDLIAAGLSDFINSADTTSSRSQLGSQSNLANQSTRRPARPVLGTSSLANNTNRIRPPLTNQNEFNTVGRYVRQGSVVSGYDGRARQAGKKLVSQSQPLVKSMDMLYEMRSVIGQCMIANFPVPTGLRILPDYAASFEQSYGQQQNIGENFLELNEDSQSLDMISLTSSDCTSNTGTTTNTTHNPDNNVIVPSGNNLSLVINFSVSFSSSFCLSKCSTSREVSPSRLAYFAYGIGNAASNNTSNDTQKVPVNSYTNNRNGGIGLDNAERSRFGLTSRVPRSQGASREPSPTRSTASGYTVSSFQHNNSVQLSGASGIGQLNYRKQQRR